MGGPLRIGILGTANIARSFVKGVQPSERVAVTAIASRNADRAASFAAELKIAGVFGSYETLLADRDIDAVYNPLPNGLHAEWSIAAARAGQRTVGEKALPPKAAGTRRM